MSFACIGLIFLFQEKEEASDAEAADTDFEDEFESNELKVLNTLNLLENTDALHAACISQLQQCPLPHAHPPCRSPGIRNGELETGTGTNLFKCHGVVAQFF